VIIVSVTGPTMDEALAQVTGSRRDADLIELRLDMIQAADPGLLMWAAGHPVIATCRPAWEGGRFTGSESERLDVLVFASRLGASLVDIELSAGRAFREDFLRKRGESHLIVSHHLSARERFSVQTVYGKLQATGADVVKFAFSAEDCHENREAFRFLELAARDRQPAIAIAMGEAGEPSRVLYRKFGGWATYAAPDDRTPAAPGQIPVSLLKRVYRSHMLDRRTAVYGVVGQPLRQSKGVYIHNELFHRAEKNAVYCRFSVGDLRKFMTEMAPLLHGFSVTIPHKEDILHFLDRVERGARPIGAVNTVIRRAGKFIGSNTDAGAALDAIETVDRVRGKTVLVIGAGGAARAIAYEARRRGARLLVANRTMERARRFVRDFSAELVPMETLSSVAFDILVNATSVGMTPEIDATPVPANILKGKMVFDVVYSPPTTRLLREASAAGATIVPGTEMYLRQAAKQSRLFVGAPPDLDVMRTILFEHLEPRS
jgi:3-dehydroquinate dehydratase / shikimate dehydrogenase